MARQQADDVRYWIGRYKSGLPMPLHQKNRVEVFLMEAEKANARSRAESQLRIERIAKKAVRLEVLEKIPLKVIAEQFGMTAKSFYNLRSENKEIWDAAYIWLDRLQDVEEAKARATIRARFLDRVPDANQRFDEVISNPEVSDATKLRAATYVFDRVAPTTKKVEHVGGSGTVLRAKTINLVNATLARPQREKEIEATIDAEEPLSSTG